MSDDLEPTAATDPAEPDFHREVVDRRARVERRQRTAEESGYDGPERRVADRRTGLERRRGAGIRREEDRRSAEEGEMNVEQFEFVQAIEAFKKRSATPYPSWLDILGVVTTLGYRVIEKSTVRLIDAKQLAFDISKLKPEEQTFVRAVEAYKAVNKKRFPTWTEVLEVVEQLGYRKVQARAVDLQAVPEAPLTPAIKAVA